LFPTLRKLLSKHLSFALGNSL